MGWGDVDVVLPLCVSGLWSGGGLREEWCLLSLWMMGWADMDVVLALCVTGVEWWMIAWGMEFVEFVEDGMGRHGHGSAALCFRYSVSFPVPEYNKLTNSLC